MSLFGDDHTFTPSRNRQSGSLFDDNPAHASAKPNSSSLFADDSAAAWSMPTPKKAARANVVKNLLKPSEVPEAYVDVYDALLVSDGAPEGNVGVAGVRRVVERSGLDKEVRERILEIVNAEGRPDIGRGEVWVLLALVGLAQEGEEVGLDAVDERRKSEWFPSFERVGF
jgi:sorting nexin-8